jgi:hypothetical protein
MVKVEIGGTNGKIGENEKCMLVSKIGDNL